LLQCNARTVIVRLAEALIAPGGGMATHDEHLFRARCWRQTLALLGLALVAGCVAPTREPARSAAPPQLLGAAELDIPLDCEVTPGAVYRTNFKVQSDGHVSDAISEAGDGCVQRALRDWVATFSYAPLPATTAVAFDWLLVTANRSN
jgi:hypothetical protein